MIKKFDGKYAFLSNFALSPIVYEGIVYPTVEHAFQAAKTFDMTQRFEIANLKTPGAAKRAGRSVKLREDWEEVKEQVMEDCLRAKFQDPSFREQILLTGDEFLVEGTTWHDQYWGICTCDKCGGNGRNRLGYLLMKIREEIRDEVLSTMFPEIGSEK